jgi:hypothetical protein
MPRAVNLTSAHRAATPDVPNFSYIAVFDGAPEPPGPRENGTFILRESGGTAVYLDGKKLKCNSLKREKDKGIPKESGDGFIACYAYSIGDLVWYFAMDATSYQGVEYFPVWTGKKGRTPDSWSWTQRADLPSQDPNGVKGRA